MATQSELQWIAQNQGLAQSLFGSTNPPNGQVAQYVHNWYMQPEQANEVPDATDSAIFNEFGMSTPKFQPGAGGQQTGGPAATAPAPSVPATTVGGGFNSAQYGQAHPDLLNNWNKVQQAKAANDPVLQSDPTYAAISRYPTLEAYLQADSQGYPGGFGNASASVTSTAPASGGTTPSTTGGGTFSNLVPSTPTTPSAPNVPFTPVSAPTTGGNFNQSQAGNQAGSFATTGLTNTAQQQTSGQTQVGSQSGFSNLVGTNAQQQNQAQQTVGSTNQQQQTAGTSAQQQQQTGTTAQQQQTGQTSQQQQVSNQTGQQVGTDISHQVGNVGTTNVTRTTPEDTLGFGALLQGQQGAAGATDAERNAYLQDFMKTGGSAFGSQVDQAVRNSLTGPQMTGAGDSARARASGYAAAQIARQNADQRLQAAQQLAGPTAVEQLSTAANPYIGSTASSTGNQAIDTTTRNDSNVATNNATNTTTGQQMAGFSNLTGQNTQNTNTTGQQQGISNTQAQNIQNVLSQLQSTGQNTQAQTSGQNNVASTTGFQNLVGSTAEGQAGTALGQSSQAAAGQIPQAQQVSTGGGGCVLCTAGIELGIWRNVRVLRHVIDYKMRTKAFHSAARGYFAFFTPFARWLLTHPKVARTLAPLARAVVYEELRVAGRKLPRKPWASLVHWTGHTFCHLIGKLPVAGRVTDPVIERIARRNNVWFQLS